MDKRADGTCWTSGNSSKLVISSGQDVVKDGRAEVNPALTSEPCDISSCDLQTDGQTDRQGVVESEG